jgi:hypothetical protein
VALPIGRIAVTGRTDDASARNAEAPLHAASAKAGLAGRAIDARARIRRGNALALTHIPRATDRHARAGIVLTSAAQTDLPGALRVGRAAACTSAASAATAARHASSAVARRAAGPTAHAAGSAPSAAGRAVA